MWGWHEKQGFLWILFLVWPIIPVLLFCPWHVNWTDLTNFSSIALSPAVQLQITLLYTSLLLSGKKKKKNQEPKKEKKEEILFRDNFLFFLIFLFYKLLYGLIVWSRQVVGSGEYQFHIILLLRPIFIYNMSLLKKKKYICIIRSTYMLKIEKRGGSNLEVSCHILSSEIWFFYQPYQ